MAATTYYLLFTTYYPIRTTCYLLFTTYYSDVLMTATTYYLLLTTHYLGVLNGGYYGPFVDVNGAYSPVPPRTPTQASGLKLRGRNIHLAEFCSFLNASLSPLCSFQMLVDTALQRAEAELSNAVSTSA